MRLNVVNRFFFDRSVFLETVPKAHYVFDQHTRIQVFQPSINNRYSSNNYQYGFGLPIKIGLGRLEQVEDARRTLFVLRNLAKHNLIDSVSYQDIDELAFSRVHVPTQHGIQVCVKLHPMHLKKEV